MLFSCAFYSLCGDRCQQPIRNPYRLQFVLEVPSGPIPLAKQSNNKYVSSSLCNGQARFLLRYSPGGVYIASVASQTFTACCPFHRGRCELVRGASTTDHDLIKRRLAWWCTRALGVKTQLEHARLECHLPEEPPSWEELNKLCPKIKTALG